MFSLDSIHPNPPDLPILVTPSDTATVELS